MSKVRAIVLPAKAHSEWKRSPLVERISFISFPFFFFFFFPFRHSFLKRIDRLKPTFGAWRNTRARVCLASTRMGFPRVKDNRNVPHRSAGEMGLFLNYHIPSMQISSVKTAGRSAKYKRHDASSKPRNRLWGIFLFALTVHLCV